LAEFSGNRGSDGSKLKLFRLGFLRTNGLLLKSLGNPKILTRLGRWVEDPDDIRIGLGRNLTF